MSSAADSTRNNSRSTKSSNSITDESTEALEHKVNELKQRKSALLAEKDRLEVLRQPNQNLTDSLYQAIIQSSLRKSAAQTSHAFRALGFSCFNVDLARGSFERSRTDIVKKGLAVRIEVFTVNKYFEPYYVIFSKPVLNEDFPSLIHVPHHTIPHHIPLRSLAERYLGWKSHQKSVQSYIGSKINIQLFLRYLQSYLIAFVNRREQINILKEMSKSNRNTPQSQSSNEDEINYTVKHSDGFHQILVEWPLPSIERQTVIVQTNSLQSKTYNRKLSIEIKYFDTMLSHLVYKLGYGIIGGQINIETLTDSLPTDSYRGSESSEPFRNPQPDLVRQFFNFSNDLNIEYRAFDLYEGVRRLKEQSDNIEEDLELVIHMNEEFEPQAPDSDSERLSVVDETELEGRRHLEQELDVESDEDY